MSELNRLGPPGLAEQLHDLDRAVLDHEGRVLRKEAPAVVC